MKGNMLKGLCTTAFLLVGLATTAPTAAFPGYERVTAVSVSDSLNPKTVTVTCPAGKQVVGTGGFITGGFGQVVMDRIFPNGGLTSVTVRGYEDEDGTAANWSVRAYAVCGLPPAGLELVTATSASNSLNVKDVRARCSPGKKVIGTGAQIIGGLGQVVIDELIPVPDSASARAFEDGTGTTANWSVRAYAICAAPLSGYSILSARSVESSYGPKSVQASCPAGKVSLGGGWNIDDGFGQVLVDQVTPRSSGVMVTGYEDDDGTSASWDLTSYAICAP